MNPQNEQETIALLAFTHLSKYWMDDSKLPGYNVWAYPGERRLSLGPRNLLGTHWEVEVTGLLGNTIVGRVTYYALGGYTWYLRKVPLLIVHEGDVNLYDFQHGFSWILRQLGVISDTLSTQYAAWIWLRDSIKHAINKYSYWGNNAYELEWENLCNPVAHVVATSMVRRLAVLTYGREHSPHIPYEQEWMHAQALLKSLGEFLGDYTTSGIS